MHPFDELKERASDAATRDKFVTVTLPAFVFAWLSAMMGSCAEVLDHDPRPTELGQLNARVMRAVEAEIDHQATLSLTKQALMEQCQPQLDGRQRKAGLN